jgi:hypothetical protein
VNWIATAAIVALTTSRGWAQSSAATAQPPASASLRQIAETKSAEWETLAKALDAKIARMLPCDSRVKSAITEVSRASEARLAALGEAMKAAVDRAAADSEHARLAVADEEGRRRESAAERVDSGQERAAVEGQLADLTESAKRRPAFEEARQKLAGLATQVTQRASDREDAVKLETLLDASLRELLVASEAREQALRKEQAALTLEASRWSEYYAARLARAQTECTITNPTSTPKTRK